MSQDQKTLFGWNFLNQIGFISPALKYPNSIINMSIGVSMVVFIVIRTQFQGVVFKTIIDPIRNIKAMATLKMPKTNITNHPMSPT